MTGGRKVGRQAGEAFRVGVAAAELKPIYLRMKEHRSYAFEFRHPSWYVKDVFTALADHGIALCISRSSPCTLVLARDRP
jgi:hypothetical protein